MRIIVGDVMSIDKDPPKNTPNWLRASRIKKIERRKNQSDRRKSVRDGVIVTLSFKKNQRKSADRRIKN